MEYLNLFLQLLVYMIPMGLGTLLLVYMLLEVYIRSTVRGGTLFIFIDANRDMSWQMVKAKGKKTVEVGGGQYILMAERQFHSKFPYWAPTFMQETVPAYQFRHNEYEPIDITGGKNGKGTALMTANMLRDINDEVMLIAMIKEARDAAEDRLMALRHLPLFILIGVAITMVSSFVGLYLNYTMQADIKIIADAVGSVSGG